MDPVPRSLAPSFVRFALSFGVLAAGLFLGSACSSSTPACDESLCAAGNKCIDDGATGTQCRLVCGSHAECGFNHYCATNAQSIHYCAPNAPPAYKAAKGQWGELCNPKQGLDKNSDCDASQNFWCYGQSPTDAAAYCTQFQCKSDAECAGGYTCQRVNVGPDVRSPNRTLGRTTTVCKKRAFCDSCEADFDCPNLGRGVPRCAKGSDGKGFCTTECSADTSCAEFAACKPVAGITKNVCKPYADKCVGTGKLCDPCHSDKDCPDGYCIEAPFSHEKFCSVKSKKACSVDSATNSLVASCPGSAKPVGKHITCGVDETNPDLPRDQCVGVVQFGTDNSGVPVANIGCWTRKITDIPQ